MKINAEMCFVSIPIYKRCSDRYRIYAMILVCDAAPGKMQTINIEIVAITAGVADKMQLALVEESNGIAPGRLCGVWLYIPAATICQRR